MSMSSASLPISMCALQHDKPNSTLTLSTLPLPTVTGTEHLVRVAACTVTAGELLWPRDANYDISIPGVDASGIVVQAPVDSKFPAGTEVFYRTKFPKPGSLRQFSLAEQSWLARKPKNASFVDAAAIPVSALTAWQGLFEKAGLTPPSTQNLTPGQGVRVLVNGASGAVGMWVVQLAKTTGATVVATCSSSNLDMVKSLGADEIIDYTKQQPSTWAEEDELRKVDLVFDTVGRKSRDGLWHTIKPGGLLLTIAPPEDMVYVFDLETPKEVDQSIKGKFFIMRPSGEQLCKVAELVEEGKARAMVDSVFTLDRFEEAFARSASGRCVGKVVIQVAEEWS